MTWSTRKAGRILRERGFVGLSLSSPPRVSKQSCRELSTPPEALISTGCRFRTFSLEPPECGILELGRPQSRPFRDAPSTTGASFPENRSVLFYRQPPPRTAKGDGTKGITRIGVSRLAPRTRVRARGLETRGLPWTPPKRNPTA